MQHKPIISTLSNHARTSVTIAAKASAFCIKSEDTSRSSSKWRQKLCSSSLSSSLPFFSHRAPTTSVKASLPSCCFEIIAMGEAWAIAGAARIAVKQMQDKIAPALVKGARPKRGAIASLLLILSQPPLSELKNLINSNRCLFPQNEMCLRMWFLDY